MASRGGGRRSDGRGGAGGGRGPVGRGGDGRRRGPGGRGGGDGGYGHQQPYGRGDGSGRGGRYQQAYYGRGTGGGRCGWYQQPFGCGGGGGGRGRGGGEVLARPTVPRPAAATPPVAAPVDPEAATTTTRPHPPPPAASSNSSSAPPPAASALTRDMGRLAVADPAPRAPAARPGAVAPAAGSEAEAPAYQQQQAPPVSNKRIVHPARPGRGELGMKVNVRANHFFVQLADKDICQYDVSISPEPKARHTNRVLLSKLVEDHAATWSLNCRTPAYDGSKILYTVGELPFKSMDFVVKLGKECREIEFKITIRYVGCANVYHLQQFLGGQQRDSPKDTIQALDVVLRESPSLNCVKVSRSFFNKGFGCSDIGEGLECWRGYYQSLRPTQMGLSLNIDISSTAFYKPIPVIEFVENCVGAKNCTQPIADRDRLKLKKALRGARVQTTHGKRSVYKITGITSAPLAQLNFSLNEEGQMTVVQYFASRYKCQLEYTAWPCLQSGNDSKPIYLPMEVCEIIEGQKYPKKLSPKQVTEILRATCERPEERKKSILKMVGQNNYSAGKLAQVFGITVAKEMASVQARVLPPPRLKYRHESGREETCAPSHGKWNMYNKKMVNGGSVQSWTCLNFSSSASTDDACRICGNLARRCNLMGMDFNRTPVIKIRSTHPNQIEVALRDVNMRAPDLQLLIVILPDVADHYGKIKRLCETELGIVSQCMNIEPKKTHQYYENVALKINVKVGGHNTVLERALPFVSDTPTIIFGADVTHPAAGDDSSASIAAVVASMDCEVMTYKALVSAQAHRQEIIQDLFLTRTDPEKGTRVKGGMIRELLFSFFQKTGKKPGRIIFYRDGVSEGQFSHVLLHEMNAIREACTSLEEGYLPKVTFVVVQKRHHTRLFPGEHENHDTSGNIAPGTVVDTTICHPSEFDFYLCSHAGIMGTSRPAHYHVLCDENRFSADELQMLTNGLCYTYARCTRSLSVVPPVYYAHLAAYRARFYNEGEGTDAATVVSGGAAGGAGGPPAPRPLPQVQEKVKNVMFFC